MRILEDEVVVRNERVRHASDRRKGDSGGALDVFLEWLLQPRGASGIRNELQRGVAHHDRAVEIPIRRIEAERHRLEAAVVVKRIRERELTGARACFDVLRSL